MKPVLIRDADLSIRELGGDLADLELLVSWRARPHVSRWWDTDEEPAFTIEAAIAESGPGADVDTTSCFIELGGRPIGFVQYYRWWADPDGARDIGVPQGPDVFGLDVLIGELDAVGVGLGSRAVDMMCGYLFEQGATCVALATALENGRAQRAFEKAGFHKVKQVLDTDTRGGERVESWLMVRERSVPFEP